MSTDDFGDRMKSYEQMETGKFMPLLPIYARLDGKGFSKFTKGMSRPYDERMHACMVETAKYLVKETGAKIGYTQSDEISLVWHSGSVYKQIWFDGKKQKMVSVLAAMATMRFNRLIQDYMPEYTDRMPIFDCRAFTLPTLVEASNALLWREQDATKNAVSMAARSMFSHKALENKSGPQMKKMMLESFEVDFEDYPAAFSRGTFVRSEQKLVALRVGEYYHIPEKHRPTDSLGFGAALRSVMVAMEMPKFSSVVNRVKVVFDGEYPETENADWQMPPIA